MTRSGWRRATIPVVCGLCSAGVSALLPPVALALDLVLAWTANATAPRGSLEYRDLCVAPVRGDLLVLAALRGDGGDRELVTVRVQEGGVGPLVTVPGTEAFGALVDAYRCAFFGEDELLIVGRARDGSVVASVAAGRSRESLALGSGGYEVIVYDLIHLGARKFAMAGSRRLTGFVATFDLDTKLVSWRELGKQGSSLLTDLSGSEREGLTVCGMEGGDDAELFSPSSRLIVASLDEAGQLRHEMRIPGRACHLAEGGEGTVVLYEWGEPPPGPLRRLRLDPALAIEEDAIVLDKIAYFISLRAAPLGSMLAVLNRPLDRERIELVDPSSGRSLGSTRLGPLLSAEIDVAAAGEELVVISQPRDETASSRIRIDAYRLP